MSDELSQWQLPLIIIVVVVVVVVVGVRSRHLPTVAFSVLNSSRRGYPGEEGAHIALSKCFFLLLFLLLLLLLSLLLASTETDSKLMCLLSFSVHILSTYSCNSHIM